MTRFLIVIGFVVWFGAGLAVGWRVASPQKQPVRPPHGGGGGWIAQQLNLTPEQQKQMDAIWSPLVGRGGPSNRDTRAQYRRERDAAIANLIPEDQKEAYQKVIDEYNAKMSALESQGRQAFMQAIEKTKAILTPEQRVKYEELMAKVRREPDGRERGRPQHGPSDGPPPPNHEPQTPPTPTPETQQAPQTPAP